MADENNENQDANTAIEITIDVKKNSSAGIVDNLCCL